MISGIIKVEVSVISRSRKLRLITLTETLIIPDNTKTSSNNCFIIHCFEENTNALSQRSQFIFKHIALGNHALRAQPTYYSLTCRYRLVNNL